MEQQLAMFKILIELTNKKICLLEQILDITENQTVVLSSPNANSSIFLQMFDEKQKRIDYLADLDNSFSSLYNKVSFYIVQNKNVLSMFIGELKEKITTVTDLSVKIKVLEEKNNRIAASLHNVSKS